MCYNCGCNNPWDDMGHSDNITRDTLDRLAKELGKTSEQTGYLVIEHVEGKTKNPQIAQMFTKAAAAWKQSVTEAEKHTISLLKRELPS